ncbi:hypothetical protein BBN63_26675 [Streptomyces niveus]|uniref:Uncharacterized protein n=1 Tax=Streptomyces niveus TaxID=193462 RepID=A0A1U9QYC0_STRNV|nr:hypothetical protein BBN63_26675 [Streptomyces niveus]
MATISSSTPQAIAQPGRPAIAKTAVPNPVQIRPHTLSHQRIRSGLRAVTGSLPVRMASHLL